jgi:Opacity family porin protein
MNRTHLISLTAVAMAMTGVVASGANAQEKQYSIGPAIEFSGGGTSFGIKGKIGVGPSISIRPSILFGYTPSVDGATFSKAIVNGSTNILSTTVGPLTTEQKRAIVRQQVGDNVTDPDGILAAATAAAEADRTPLQKALVAATQPVPRTNEEKIAIVIARAPAGTTLTESQARTNLDAAVTAGASGTDEQKALVTATQPVPLTPAKKQEIVRTQVGLAESDATVDTTLAAAVTAGASGTTGQKALVTATSPTIPFAALTRLQKRAQLKLLGDLNLTNQQADDLAARTSKALTTPVADQTAEQKILVLNIAGFPTFAAANSDVKRANIKEFYNSTASDVAIDAAAVGLTSILLTPTAEQKAEQKTGLAILQSRVTFTSAVNAVGFTPGSGTAYGAAVTYDFETSDKKLTGYVGPKVMFANGSSKVGNFDTNTSETSFGLLVGADYAITPDFTAGLSGTYNFSKSGTLNVSGAGGFNGSSSFSGSSFDVGLSLGYRF